MDCCKKRRSFLGHWTDFKKWVLFPLQFLHFACRVTLHRALSLSLRMSHAVPTSKKPNWSAGKPASLRAVYIIYCICFFYINWAFCLWYKEIKITFIIITQSRGTGTSPWNHLFSFWHLHQLSLCKPPLNRHFSLMYAAQIIQSIISMIMCSCSSVYCVHRTPCVVLSLPRYLCILLLCKLSGFSLSLNRCCSTNNSSSLNFNGSNSESLHRAGNIKWWSYLSTKYSLVPASQMWRFVAFLCFISI